ncbi:MAG: hypothetical protein ACREF1_03785, partial [Acetobacteraceae bacterium]
MNRAAPLRLLAASALAVLSGCATLNSLNPFGGGSEKKAVVDPSTIPATQLYNNGVDALEGQR